MKYTRIILLLLLIVAIVVGCEQHDLAPKRPLDESRLIVSAQDIPRVTSALMEKMGLVNGDKPFSVNQNTSQNQLKINWDQIKQLTDSIGRQTYAFGIEDYDDDPFTFYNLVFKVSEHQEAREPYLLRYEMAEDFIAEYLSTGSFLNFRGTITKVLLNGQGGYSGGSVYSDEDGEETVGGNDCPNTTVFAGNSSGNNTTGGGFIPPDSYGTNDDGCMTYVIATDWYSQACNLNTGACEPAQYMETTYEFVTECDNDLTLNSSADDDTGCESNDGSTPIVLDDLDDPCKTSAEEIGEAFPNASAAAKDSLASVLNANAEKFGIDTKEKLQHFLSQAGHETGGFGSLKKTENLNYTTAARLVQVWPTRFSQDDSSKADPDDYINDPEKLANLVYADRMGNGDEDSGDGYKYRGRGIFQLSGKENYETFNEFYQLEFDSDVDFISDPSLVGTNERYAILSALWFYKKNVIDKLTIDSETTVDAVTKKINGGTTGILDRKSKHNDTKEHIDDCEQ